MVGIIIDTNILNSGSRDFTIAQFSTKLDDIIREIESNDNYQDIKILLPQIVIEELLTHQIYKYTEWIFKIQGLKLSNDNIKTFDDYDTHLRDLFDKTILNMQHSTLKCEVVPYPNNIVLPQIIKRALHKRAPFEGLEKNSDKGFKDVILWESLLEYKRLHSLDIIILYSNDKRICDNSLAIEYKELFKDDVYLLNRIKENDDSLLYSKLSELFNQPYNNSFSEQIKNRLLDVVSNDNISPLFEGDSLHEDNYIYKCDYIRIEDKSIVNIEDSIVDKKIKFKVNIQMQVNARNENSSIFTSANCNLHIEYSFPNDTFYLKESDSIFGYSEYIKEGIELY